MEKALKYEQQGVIGFMYTLPIPALLIISLISSFATSMLRGFIQKNIS